ncbi:MAG TPA: nitroreductase family protein [Bacteroidales bacterium]|jgi:nitroreductase|nr:nitroreductase family protein [Bacteroidales bacterium]HRT34075.1 nitroreductase family protein [Bacteroidales bacterium]
MIPFAKNRSYRRFYQDVSIDEADLIKMVEAARLSPSSRNMQPIKFFITNDRNMNDAIFKNLSWAGYLLDWDGPEEGERPSAYIIMLHDKKISSTYSCDNGIFAQSILLQAVDLGFGGCIIGSLKKDAIAKLLQLPEHLEPILAVALGKPKENVIIEDMKNGDVKYWRDDSQNHHVPKRTLDELIYKIK